MLFTEKKGLIALLLFLLLQPAILYSASETTPILNLLLSTNDKIQLVKKFSGFQPFSSFDLVVFEGLIWFASSDSDHGQELWQSDGTAQGTVMVADIQPGPTGSTPYFLTSYKNGLYFFAADNTNGLELRKTFWDSGTSTYRTILVKDINPGSAHGVSLQGGLIPFRDRLFFVADDGVNGMELWMTDGTPVGTERVTDIAPGSGDASPKNITVFTTDDVLFGDILLFSADDGSSGRELWRLHRQILTGKFATKRVMDIWQGLNSGNPEPLVSSTFTLYDGNLYFIAEDATTGKELWKTNGFSTGTSRVADINNGSHDSISQPGGGAAVFKNEFYFSAYNGSTFSLWKTDGTTSGTVQAFNTSVNQKLFVNFPYNNKLFFSVATDLNGTSPSVKLWKRFWDQPSLSWQAETVDNLLLLPPAYSNLTTNIEVNQAMYFSGLTVTDSSTASYARYIYKMDDRDRLVKIVKGQPVSHENGAVSYVSFKNAIYFFAFDEDNNLMLLKINL